jgi:hypothetical protein
VKQILLQLGKPECSREPTSCYYLGTDNPSPYPRTLSLRSVLILSYLLTSRSPKGYPAFKFTIQDFIFNSCPSHQILPDLISLILFHQDESLWISSLCKSSFPLPNVTFCLICPTSLFSDLFSDTCNLLMSQSPRLCHHAA